MENNIQKIIPNLWFNGNAKEAVDFYVSVFPDAKVIATSHYPKSKKEGLAGFQLNMAGKVLTVDFEIMGFRFVIINAGPEFTPNPSISFFITLDSKEEIDTLWGKLIDGGQGHEFKFNEGVSLLISCKDQDEIDYYWEKLTADGGEESVCGWLKGKYGVSWQVAPANMK
jgi:predicted 3-demethylubiquinone-9 3-methyltransferase (glyoxalase superfamily)